MPHTTQALAQWRTQRHTVENRFRQTMVCSLDKLKDEELVVELQRLCNELLDYVSTGHFSIYTRPLLKTGTFQVGSRIRGKNRCQLQSKARSRTRGFVKEPVQGQTTTDKSLMKNICRHIGNSTDQVLSFNEKYETLVAGCIPGSLQGDLKKLQRTLSLRYALEEQLLVL